MTPELTDMTQVLQETTRRGVGVQRWQRPVYVDLLPPCNHACPAGENIQAWLALAQAGEYEQAWRVLTTDNPLPAIHGRACYHPCQTACNRADLDSAVEIHSVERFLGDLADEHGWSVEPAPPTGKKVLIVGAGPAGLSCAWHLALKGVEVEIRDASAEPGGMMAHGIPAYRLPRDLVQHEISRITSLPNVTLRCNTSVDDLAAAKQEGGFDAAFVAVGARLANHLDIPATDGRRMINAIDLLADVDAYPSSELGRVAVIGGGNVAMDAARTAQRLGATDPLIVFRYDRPHMEAHPAEAQEAEVEGATVRWLSVVDNFGSDGITVEKVRMNPDGSVTPTGHTEQLPADSVVLAVGQHADLSLLGSLTKVRSERDVVQVDNVLMTDEDGIFAGGDCIGGAMTMTAATGHGKLAARAIEAWLTGGHYTHPGSNNLVTFDMLHLFDYRNSAANTAPEVPLSQRSDFGEVVGGLSTQQARHEAQRCLSCGNCFECDNCYAACPEQAITRLGPGHGYDVSLELCTGCAACFEQCPCHAIEMTSEPAGTRAAIGSLGEPLAPTGFKVRD